MLKLSCQAFIFLLVQILNLYVHVSLTNANAIRIGIKCFPFLFGIGLELSGNEIYIQLMLLAIPFWNRIGVERQLAYKRKES